MSDQFDQLFTRARPSAVSTIRPPGAEAARQTVRARKRRRNTTIAAAVVLAALGVFFIRPATSSPEPAASVNLVAQARYALGDVTGPVAVEEQGEVRDGWTVSGSAYHGEQNLTVVCAGTGTMTLRITGIPYTEGDPEQNPIEIIRVVVPCSNQPVPEERQYLTGAPESVVYTIVDSSGTAGFAFRVETPETGEPMPVGSDNRADPSVALGVPEIDYDSQVEVRGALGPDGEKTEDLPYRIGGRFTVAGACAGVGRMEVTVRQTGGRIIDTWRLPCQWPPKRHDWKPARGSGDLEVHVKFVSSLPDSITETEYALWFQPK
ncbi:MAG TPA: hypothetical protein VN408_14345 [Actinoplanes sp.]|nr:hypothetical protein [Actinoplanes sp.]